MKNYSNLGLLSFALFVLLFLSCKSSSEGENGTESATNEIENIDQKTDNPSDYAVLKAKTLDLVKANEVEIEAFKSKLQTETAANKVTLQKEIDSLLLKNAALKSTLNDYKEQGKAKLNIFKQRLQKSIDDINKDIETYKTEHK